MPIVRHNGLEYHVEDGWVKVYDPEYPNVWQSKGTAEEILPDELKKQLAENYEKENSSPHCPYCGYAHEGPESFCSDECRKMWVDVDE